MSYIKIEDYLSLKNINDFSFETFFERFADCVFIEEEEISLTYRDFQEYLTNKSKPTASPFIVLSPKNSIDTIALFFKAWMSGAIVFPTIDSDEVSIKEDALRKDFSIDSTALLIKTSGSSGPPKLIEITFKNLIYSAAGSNQFYEFKKGMSWALNLPLHHIGGMMVIFRAFLTGGRIKIIAEEKLNSPVDFISLVPTQLSLLIKNSPEKLENYKNIILGGSSISQKLERQIQEKKLSVSNSFGMTEATAQVMATRLSETNLNKVQALPYRDLSLSQESTLVIKGEVVSPGHYQGVRFNKAFYSSDLFQFDQDTFSFVGRNDLIFQSGAENISPTQIENSLDGELTIVPKKDSDYGNILVAFVNYSNRFKKYSDESTASHKKIRHLIPYEYVPGYQDGIKPNRGKLTQFAEQAIFFKDNKYVNYLYQLSEGGKPPLLFIHGMMGNAADFQALTSHLKKDYTIYSFDLPGHGTHQFKGEINGNDLFTELEGIINRVSSKALTIYSYSMGGRVLLQLLKRKNINPTSIILESAHLGIKDPSEREKRLKADKALFTGEGFTLSNFLKLWYCAPLWGSLNKRSDYSEVLKLKDSDSIKGWSQAIEFFSPGALDYIDGSFDYPLLFISGDEDVKYTLHFEDIKKVFSGARHLLIDGVGHNCHFQGPREVTRAINHLRQLWP